MYQQPNANNLEQLSFPVQRATLRSYLTCNYWVYLLYSSCNIVALIYLISAGASFNTSYPNIIYALWFFAGAVNSDTVRKRLNQPDISTPLFRKQMKGVMRWNWYVIIIQCIAVVLVVGVLIGVTRDSFDSEWYVRLSIFVGVGGLIVMIPFIIQVSRHKTMNQVLDEIGGGALATGNGSFTNQAPQPQVQVQPQVGAGYGYGQPQTQPQPSYGQQPAKPYGQPQPQPGYAQQPAKGYDNNFQNGGYR